MCYINQGGELKAILNTDAIILYSLNLALKLNEGNFSYTASDCEEMQLLFCYTLVICNIIYKKPKYLRDSDTKTWVKHSRLGKKWLENPIKPQYIALDVIDRYKVYDTLSRLMSESLSGYNSGRFYYLMAQEKLT